MSDPTNEAFVRLASAHVDLANAQARNTSRELAGVALMHAAARYNAYVGATQARNAGQLMLLRDELIADQVKSFHEALEHHYREYVATLDDIKRAEGAG